MEPGGGLRQTLSSPGLGRLMGDDDKGGILRQPLKSPEAPCEGFTQKLGFRQGLMLWEGQSPEPGQVCRARPCAAMGLVLWCWLRP